MTQCRLEARAQCQKLEPNTGTNSQGTELVAIKILDEKIFSKNHLDLLTSYDIMVRRAIWKRFLFVRPAYGVDIFSCPPVRTAGH